MKWFTMQFAAIFLSVFLLTVVAERILIPILRTHKMGQKILEIGPRWHKSKEGTPTMGGIGFILAALLVMAVFFIVKAIKGTSSDYIPLALTLGYAVANGMVGFVDDYFKLVVKKENEGLTPKQKLLLQLVLAGAYVCVMAYTGNMGTQIVLPFADRPIDLGFWYYLMAVIVLTGVVNGGNITDGIDGLASSVTFVIGVFLAIWAFTARAEQLSAISAVLMGAALGFLIYNFNPARVFMGDTGSLSLGALIASLACLNGLSLFIPLLGVMFVLSCVSVIMQVLYYKKTKKRIFLMAPLHHHFEKKGKHETKIVSIYIIITLIIAAACIMLTIICR